MRTLEEVRERCEVLPYGRSGKEHWLWSAGTTRNKPIIYGPDFTKDPSGKTMTPQYGVRAVLHIKTGEPVPEGHRAYAKCWRPLCISPDCVKSAPMKELGASLAKSGTMRGNEKRRVANSVTASRRRKVTLEIASAIKDGGSSREIAEAHGLSRSTVNRWRDGSRGKSVAAEAGMFSALMR